MIEGLTHSGATAIPAGVAKLELVGAFVSKVVISVYAALRMKREYPAEWPFRNGPVV